MQTASPGQSRLRLTARLSIAQKAALAVSALLLILSTALIATAWYQARATQYAASSQRLYQVTTQLGELLHSSALSLGTQARATARIPAVADYLRTPSPDRRQAALAALAFRGPENARVILVELRDGRDSVVLSTTEGAADAEFEVSDSRSFGELRRPASEDSIGVGRLRPVGTMVVYPVTAYVRGTGGYVVNWRRLYTAPDARGRLESLIGTSASIFLGNRDGTLWATLWGDPATPPEITGAAPGDRTGAVFRTEDHLSSSIPVPAAPWIVRVDQPWDELSAPVSDFIRGLLLIALAIVALGVALAWSLARRLTLPLTRLTEATNALAAGASPTLGATGGSDELAQLEASFATMARQVDEGRQKLEVRVEERTRELQATMAALHDAQEALVRREKLAMLGQLASGVGHELRNPLGVMTNAIYYLDYVLRDADANVREYLDILRQQVTLSERIVSDLLDFARIKQPRHEKLSLSTLVQAQLNRIAIPSTIRVLDNVSPDLPVISADAVQVGQVVLNLLSNAIQAMGETGELVISTRHDDATVSLMVSDNGPGVPAEIAEKIFEPLFTTRARGLGLGLAVSRGLAQANGGRLDLENTSGPTVFTLTLPRADSRDAESGAHEAAA
jgi:signal transduction histidine kinase